MTAVVSRVEFVHGEKTCASEPGKFCRFLYAKRFGTVPWCHLYEVALNDDGEPDGWVKRCKQCMAES